MRHVLPHRLAVRPRLFPRVDARDDDAVPLVVEEREREREIGSDIAERVVAHESHAMEIAFEHALEFVEPLVRALRGQRERVAQERERLAVRVVLLAREKAGDRSKMRTDERDVIDADRNDGDAEDETGKSADGHRVGYILARERTPWRSARSWNRAEPGARWSAAHTRAYIPLLPSGPGGVDRVALRGAQPPTRRWTLYHTRRPAPHRGRRSTSRFPPRVRTLRRPRPRSRPPP